MVLAVEARSKPIECYLVATGLHLMPAYYSLAILSWASVHSPFKDSLQRVIPHQDTCFEELYIFSRLAAIIENVQFYGCCDC